MIDVHCHLVYDVDDGAKNKEETIIMLEEAKRVGFTDIILTPHYMQDYYIEPSAKIKEKIDTFYEEAKNIGINLYQGNEIYATRDIIDLIKYTYNECNIEDISISTNGIGLNEIAYELKKSGLKSVNISLDSLKSYKYKSITRNGNLTDVLKSINRCLELGIKVKINCVVIKGFNDDEIYDFIDMANYYPVDVRFIELMPIGEGKHFFENGYFNITKFINEADGLYKIEDEKQSSAKLYQAKYA